MITLLTNIKINECVRCSEYARLEIVAFRFGSEVILIISVRNKVT